MSTSAIFVFAIAAVIGINGADNDFGSNIITNEQVPGGGIIMNLQATTLVLQCNFTEDYTSSIRWEKDHTTINNTDHTMIDERTTTLTIDHPEVEDAGVYTCTVQGKDASATIKVLANVTIEHHEKSKNQVEGDPLTLVCKATGYPIPNITWFKDDVPLNKSDPRIRFESFKNASDAKLIISDLQFSDRATYECRADNGFSQRNMTVLVRVKDKLAALWPFLGICAEVAILCTIIFVYEKRRAKPDFEESDTEAEGKSTEQREGQEVRQRVK